MSGIALHLGDSRDVLAGLQADSIDACVCDPPYELTANKSGGTGAASLNLNSPAGRSRVTTGGGFMGKAWDATGISFDPEFWRLVFRVLKPGAHLLACGGTRTYHRMASAIEDAGFEVRDCLAWLYGSGFPKSLNLGEGLGTALKPAYEPIVMARKPFIGTVKANVEAHGTGALNIDACRISFSENEPYDIAEVCRPNTRGGQHIGAVMNRPSNPTVNVNALGRWPANVALDDLAAMVLDEQSGETTSVGGTGDVSKQSGGVLGWTPSNTGGFGDVGGASRFFYIAKPSREERDAGCGHLPAKTAAELTDRKPGSAGLQNPRAGIRAGSADRDVSARVARNHHPTVKPVELMRWLVRLVTPINGTVLDPFMGSGTTGMACVAEQRRFIGIEREAAYMEIAKARIMGVAPLFTSEAAS